MKKRVWTITIVLSLWVSLLGGVGEQKAAAAPAFAHPGLLHTQADFDRMTQMVNAGTQPYLDGWNQLVNSPLSQSGWTPRATETIIRGGTGQNFALLYIDIARAYQNALRWKISGSTAHGDTARDILNAWSSTLTTITGNADRYLASGLYGYQMANAAEIMRDYPGFNVAQMQDMLLNVFYKPLSERFLIGNEFGGDHNGAYIQNYWANWDLANMAATVAIGIFCDRRDIYDIGIEYFKHGAGNGSIYNAIPFLHPGGLAQWQESGRDQAHTQLGVGLMAVIGEMAWNQGDDLYGWANNRFMRAAEYVAKYNNGDDNVPFAAYEWGNGTNGAVQTQTVISNASRNEMRPIWEMIYNHYANRKGLAVPNIAARAGLGRPEGGPNPAYASSFDQLGFGTLLYTRPAGSGSTAALHGGNIPDGIYRFAVRLDGKAMEAAGTSNGADVRKSTYTGGANQQWMVTHLGGGQYSIRNVQSCLYLDVASGSLAHGAGFQLWSGNGGDNQRFAFIPTGEGYFRMTPAHSNKPADVTGVSTAEGVPIQQWRYILGSHQQWRLEPVSVNVRLQSHNFTDRYIRHANYRARIDAAVSPVGDAQFKLVPGLTDANGVSFESVNFPGRFLRVRSNGEVWLDPNDGTAAFKNDATFRRVAGLADPQKSSYQMWSDASRYLRHSNYLLYAQAGSGATFNADATFKEVAP
ncbi:AbfB domain-containing protein [Paenibacillus sp. LHD-117]|uniref:RICIN domain-containing protein n=1 Tax=Paenibacillus sp. LHD-117 TaxID=3071412 RepID=UPI0027E05903|nr:RICIN domain-containing protein [Paenibacillus sp. LHD-117]MDQ6417912.1 AbfB domain-containing protein [Paenibacillus sp. LHD-117]